ncbi:MAG TPA: hypothetical protein PKC09_01690 [Paracoccus sp. (in: a-proteobacteria)]|nr:hypothetical protein [uncultured Paracoccus sp.]HMQ39961.1 hypothetical protein [Paracoccus sp. (in: a-proteobacteria)]HMR37835.1 hypothetical protein [Paracoccus sp. (in: a-proteobacteria)]
MKYLALIAALTLAACGVDGAPQRPEQPAPKPGVSVSGDGRIGVRADGL